VIGSNTQDDDESDDNMDEAEEEEESTTPGGKVSPIRRSTGDQKTSSLQCNEGDSESDVSEESTRALRRSTRKRRSVPNRVIGSNTQDDDQSDDNEEGESNTPGMKSGQLRRNAHTRQLHDSRTLDRNDTLSNKVLSSALSTGDSNYSSSETDLNDSDTAEIESMSEQGSKENSATNAEGESNDIFIEKIIVKRIASRKEWDERCSKINTSQIDNGSRWYQEPRNGNFIEERYLIKWKDLSYLHCSWETERDLNALVENAETSFRTFWNKQKDGYIFDSNERNGSEYFHADFVTVQRILNIDLEKEGVSRMLMVKWMNLSYANCTFELERDLVLMDVKYESQVEDFIQRNKKPSKEDIDQCKNVHQEETLRLREMFSGATRNSAKECEILISEYKKQLESMNFKNNTKLRDYQATGVSWLMANHVNGLSSILADEMGLGKVGRKQQTSSFSVNLLNPDFF
jgi:hypothetical protein